MTSVESNSHYFLTIFLLLDLSEILSIFITKHELYIPTVFNYCNSLNLIRRSCCLKHFSKYGWTGRQLNLRAILRPGLNRRPKSIAYY